MYTDRQYRMILNALPKVGPVTVMRLLREFESVSAIFEANLLDLQGVKGVGKETASVILGWEKHFDLLKEETQLDRLSGDFVVPGDLLYPDLLTEQEDAPIGLYVLGHRVLPQYNIALVGTREVSHYGRGVTQKLSQFLVSKKIGVISGLARGVDSFAHDAAISSGGFTCAVLGNGVDIVYPSENIHLYKQIKEEGLIYSEFPLGRHADRQTFPQRNRIVSSMSHAVVVVESKEKGGSMITARFAGEQGKLVYAVPGRIDLSSFKGCHKLIRDGAILLSDVEDVLEGLTPVDISENMQFSFSEEPKDFSELGESELSLWKYFEGGDSFHPDQLVELYDLDLRDLSCALLMLEMKNILHKRADGCYERAFQ